MPVQLLILLASFTVIWFSSGVALQGVAKLARRFHLSQFSVSVVLLGAVASLPEVGVLINSLVLGTPEVSLGNLMGGQMYILFFIVPILAILIGKIHLDIALQNKSLIITLLVLGAPLVLLMDNQLNFAEAWLLLGFYLVFTIVYWQKMSFLERVEKQIHSFKKGDGWLLLKVVGSMVLILLASNRVVAEIQAISSILGFHAFFVSMVVTAIGTNIPELSIMVRGLIAKRNDVVLGSYVGSASFNTLLMSGLVLGGGKSVVIDMDAPILLILIAGIFCFWYVARTKGILSRREGIFLLSFYVLFVGIGLVQELLL